MTNHQDDQRVPSGSSTSEAWDTAADWWKARSEGNDPYRHFVHGPALLEACGDVSGLQVLDVGCGSGYFSRVLAHSGANVSAFDYSSNLVQLAIDEEDREPVGIAYEQLDAARISDRFDADAFDLATGCMSIADIDRLEAALEGISKVLRPGGRFCFSLPHPISTPPENRWIPETETGGQGRLLSGYFGRRRVASGLNRVGNKPVGPQIEIWHMPISEWIDLLGEFGFVIEGLAEPRPTDEQVREYPALHRISEIPEFLVISSRLA